MGNIFYFSIDMARETCCVCIEIKMGQKILGVLMVLSAICGCLRVFQDWGTYGAWGLVNVPMLLCSIFAAWKYLKWFQAQDEKEAREGIVQAWNVQMLGFCVTYCFMCIVVMVAVPSVKADIQGQVNNQISQAANQSGLSQA